MKLPMFFATAAIAAVTTTHVSAQQAAFDNQDAAADSVAGIEEQIAEDQDRNLSQFGNQGRAIGTYGSVSLRATATQDDGESLADIGVGLRYGAFDGTNGYDVTLSYTYGNDDGEVTENNLLAGLDYRRDFSTAFFAYGKANVALDNLAETAGDYTQDIFVGAGVGYRIYNDRQTQWSVQAGPGYRVAEVVGGETVQEAAASVSSNFFRSLSETSYLTNDTDIIYSEESMVLENELAMNVSMTDSLSLRTGLTTQYNDATDGGFSDARNTLGVSVVYNFN